MLPLLLSLATVASLPSAVPPCPMREAVYQPADGSPYELRFRTDRSRLIILLRSANTGTEYQFNLTAGNGYSTTVMQPLAGGTEVATAHTVAIYAFNDDLSFRGDFPAGDDPAPGRLLAPELGRLLWYEAEAIGGPPIGSAREALPRTFFALERCGSDPQ